MNTFFFGYLPIKTKRILRSLLFAGLIFLIVWVIFGTCDLHCYPNTKETIAFIGIYIVLIGLISYIIEPFTRYKK
jgi:uncharacterized membrane protein